MSVALSQILRHHVAMRSRNITHQVARSAKSNRQERTFIRSSPTISTTQRSSGKLSETVARTMRTLLAAMQDGTQYRPITDNTLMEWIVRHTAWLGNDAQFPFYGAVGGPYRREVLEFGNSVRDHLQVAKGSGNPAPKLVDKRTSAVWLGKSDLAYEYLYGHDESPSTAGPENLRAIVETPQKTKVGDTGHPSC